MIEPENDEFLYRQVMDAVNESILAGTLSPGDRLPSLRKMAQTAGVSLPTVRQAYIELERQRRVEARPRSGFYVRHVPDAPLVRKQSVARAKPVSYRARPLVEQVFDGIDHPDLVPLGIASPSMALPASKALHRTMKRLMVGAEDRALSYSATLGEPSLRRQIAYHLLDTTGAQVDPESLLVTNGAQEALMLSLMAVAGPGDVIAVESPTYHGMLELIDSLSMLAIEVETCPEEGVVIGSLEAALERYPIKACLFSTTLTNPLGVCMPAVDRKRLVALLEAHDVVLIEDDVYGELHFDGSRPVPAQFLRSNARILTCGSFSKTVAPGYRIGWIAGEAFFSELARLKRSLSCSSGLLPQLTLENYLATGSYTRHVRRLVSVLRQNAERMSAQVEQCFPEGTRISQPVGGCVLWVELPRGSDSTQLFTQARAAGMSIAPGRIFSPSGRYSNCLRLSFGHPWNDEFEDAIRRLGELAKGLR